MPIPQMVLYDREHCDPVVLVQRLRVLNAVRAQFKAHTNDADTPMLDAAIEAVEDLLGERLPELPPYRML